MLLKPKFNNIPDVERASKRSDSIADYKIRLQTLVREELRRSGRSGNETGPAAEELLGLLLKDPILTSACDQARAEPSIGASEFEKRLERGLRVCSDHLKEEANGPGQAAAVRSLHVWAGRVANEMRKRWWADASGSSPMATFEPAGGLQVAKSERLDPWLEHRAEADAKASASNTDAKGESDDSEETGAADPLANFLRGIENFITTSAAFADMRQKFTMYAMRPSRIRRKIIRMWKSETGKNVPMFMTKCEAMEEVQAQRLSNPDASFGMAFTVAGRLGTLESLPSDIITTKDRVQHTIECVSQQRWDWWPLHPPLRPLVIGKVRVRWQMVWLRMGIPRVDAGR